MDPLTPNTHFAHHRLDAYWVALKLARQAKAMAAKIPRGFRRIADQLLRSGTNPVLLVAEGANRHHSGAKRMRFSEAKGEAGEAAAAAETAVGLELVEQAEAVELMLTADRLCGMMTKLIRRFS